MWYPASIAEDIPMKTHRCFVRVDIVVLDMDIDNRSFMGDLFWALWMHELTSGLQQTTSTSMTRRKLLSSDHG